MVYSSWKTVFGVYQGGIYVITYSLAFPFLGICPARICTLEHQETCARMLIIALFVMVKNENNSLICGMVTKYNIVIKMN